MPFRIRAPCVPRFPGGRIRLRLPRMLPVPARCRASRIPCPVRARRRPRARASRTMPTLQPGRGDAPSRTRPTGNKKGTRKNHPGSLHMAGRRSLPTDLSKPVRGRRRGEGRPRDSRNKSRPPMLARTAEIGKPLRAARRTPRQSFSRGCARNAAPYGCGNRRAICTAPVRRGNARQPKLRVSITHTGKIAHIPGGPGFRQGVQQGGLPHFRIIDAGSGILRRSRTVIPRFENRPRRLAGERFRKGPRLDDLRGGSGQRHVRALEINKLIPRHHVSPHT